MRLLRFAATIAVVLSIAPEAVASGVGAAPDSMGFSLTREGSDTQTLVLIVEGEEAGDLRFEITGQAAAWITLSMPNGDTPVNSIDMGLAGRSSIEVDVAIPADIGNGVYLAEIRIFTFDASVQAAVVVPLSVEVAGDAVVSGVLEHLAIPPVVEEGEDVRITASVRNDGTVRVTPRIGLELSDGSNLQARSTTAFDTLPPGSTTDLVATVGQTAQDGDLLGLEIVVRFDEVVIAQHEESLEVVAVGTRPQAITPVSIVLADAAQPGGVARLVATFKNDGSSTADFQFVGVVSLNGEPVASVDSIPVQARPGAADSVDLFVPIESGGAYSIAGQWTGDGSASEQVTFEWEVGSGVARIPVVAVILGLGFVLAALSLRRGRRAKQNNETMHPVKMGIGAR